MSLAQPVTSRPIDHVPSTFTREVVKVLFMTRLGILIEEEATAMITVGAKVRLTWLTGPYNWYIQSGSYVWATIAYLLHLVDNMIFFYNPRLTSMSPTSSTSTT